MFGAIIILILILVLIAPAANYHVLALMSRLEASRAEQTSGGRELRTKKVGIATITSLDFCSSQTIFWKGHDGRR